MSGLYAAARNGFLVGEINWVGDSIMATLLDVTTYVVDLAAHNMIEDVPAEARVSTVSLTGRSATNGVAKADSPTFPGVTGPEVGALVLWIDTGSEISSRLIAYIDNVVGLPTTPSGSGVPVQWDARGIFAL